VLLVKSTENQHTMKNQHIIQFCILQQDTTSIFLLDVPKMLLYQAFSRNDTQRTDTKNKDRKNIIDYLK